MARRAVLLSALAIVQVAAWQPATLRSFARVHRPTPSSVSARFRGETAVLRSTAAPLDVSQNVAVASTDVTHTTAVSRTTRPPAKRLRLLFAGLVAAGVALLHGQQVIAGLGVAHGAYEAAALSHPLLTKATTSGVAYLLGDMLAQRLVARGSPLDRWRVTRSAVAGFVSHGPQCHFWGLFLDTHVQVGGAATTLLAKIVLDQTVFALYLNSVFCLLLETMKGNSWRSALQQVRATSWPSLKSSWRLWPAVNALTYSVVPQPMRVLWMDFIEIGWVAILATTVNKQTTTDTAAAAATESYRVQSLRAYLAELRSARDHAATRRAAVRASLSHERVRAARAWFETLDADGGGTLDEDEVFRAVSCESAPGDVTGGVPIVSRAHVARLFREIDVDRSGAIDFEEFLMLVTELFPDHDGTGDSAMHHQDRVSSAGLADSDAPSQQRFREFLASRYAWTRADDAAAAARLRQARATLSEEQIASARQWFDEIDADGGGTLDEGEVYAAVRRMAPAEKGITRGLIGDLVAEIDINRSGDVDFEEFLLLVGKLDEAAHVE